MDEGYGTTRSGYIAGNFMPLNLRAPQLAEEDKEPGFWRRRWDHLTSGPPQLSEQRDVMDVWNQQIQQEYALSPVTREIEAEASFNPWVEMFKAQGAAAVSGSAGLAGLGASVLGRDEQAENYGGMIRSSADEAELGRRRISDRAETAGNLRTTFEMATPALTMATAAVPLGAGFRALPAAVQASRFGRFVAPSAGRIGKAAEFTFNRAAPAYFISEAGANEIPGQATRNLAPEIAGYGGFMATYGIGNVIKSRLNPARRVTRFLNSGAPFLGGVAGGFGAAIGVGNAIDEQRVSTGRQWSFQDQDRLDWAYNEHPEWFPEFQR